MVFNKMLININNQKRSIIDDKTYIVDRRVEIDYIINGNKVEFRGIIYFQINKWPGANLSTMVMFEPDQP